MNRKHWFVLLIALSFAGCSSAKTHSDNATHAKSAPAAAAQTSSASTSSPELAKLSCTRGDETRVLQVTKTGPGCSLDYTKEGKMKAIASSTHGLKHCVSSQKKIRSHLEKAGFKCA